MMGGFRLGQVAGIEVQIDWSLLIVFVLISTSLALGLFPAWHPDWSAALSWLVALTAAVLFFGSVLAHELSHALVGRMQGITVRRITLFVFGGVAQLEREPHEWRAELWMAIVGPATSLALALVCLLAAAAFAGNVPIDMQDPQRVFAALGVLPTLLVWLGQVNLILALFNLVPGFPLDGGRVLRAVMWGLTGNLRRATRLASAAGQGFAWLLIGLGLSMMLGARVPFFGTGPIAGLWLAFIGWFLNNAALVSYRQLLVREALEDVPVSRLMLTRFAVVPPDMTVNALVQEHVLRSDQRAFPVLDRERLIGMVCLRDVHALDRAAWESTPVRDIMTPLERVTWVNPGQDALEALAVLAQKNVNQLPVIENGRVRGLVRREDILKWLSLYGEADAASGRREAPG
jgi:Zn-dependent protease/CBS domain-containing protein